MDRLVSDHMDWLVRIVKEVADGLVSWNHVIEEYTRNEEEYWDHNENLWIGHVNDTNH